MEGEWWDYLAERGLCVGNTYIEFKSLHKYIRVATGQDRVEVKISGSLQRRKEKD